MRRREDFIAARNCSAAQSPSCLVVRRRRADADPTVRLGLVVTRKLGSAVKRNRIRRRLRAAMREVAAELGEAGSDYVLIGRTPALDRAYVDLLDDLRRALLSLARKPK